MKYTSQKFKLDERPEMMCPRCDQLRRANMRFGNLVCEACNLILCLPGCEEFAREVMRRSARGVM